MTRERKDLTLCDGYDRVLVCARTTLKDPLNDIVAILVLHQLLGMAMELLEQRPALGSVTVLKDSLQHAARVTVRRELKDLALERLGNEIDPGGANALDDLLDHVVRILVLDALKHMALQFLGQRNLLFDENVLQGLYEVR